MSKLQGMWLSVWKLWLVLGGGQGWFGIWGVRYRVSALAGDSKYCKAVTLIAVHTVNSVPHWSHFDTLWHCSILVTLCDMPQLLHMGPPPHKVVLTPVSDNVTTTTAACGQLQRNLWTFRPWIHKMKNDRRMRAVECLIFSDGSALSLGDCFVSKSIFGFLPPIQLSVPDVEIFLMLRQTELHYAHPGDGNTWHMCPPGSHAITWLLVGVEITLKTVLLWHSNCRSTNPGPLQGELDTFLIVSHVSNSNRKLPM